MYGILSDFEVFMYGKDQPVRIVTPSRVSGEVLRFARAVFFQYMYTENELISDIHTEEKKATVSSRGVGFGEFAKFFPIFHCKICTF